MRKFVIIAIFVSLFTCSLLLGPQHLDWNSQTGQILFWHSRLPRTLAVILSGSTMSVAGLVMQTMTQNRFAAPATTGTVEGAKLGVLLSLWWVPNGSQVAKTLLGFIFSLLSTLFFFGILKGLKKRQVWDIPLFGTLYGQIISAAAGAIAYHYDLIQSMASWQQGSFSMIQQGNYEWLFVGLGVIFWFYGLHRALTIMQLGEQTATSLGIPYRLLTQGLLWGVCLITTVNVISVGVLPFIGIIIPNLVRRFYPDRVELTLVLTGVYGAGFVLLCDLLGRVLITPYEIPVGLVLSSLGGLIFLALLFVRKEMRE